MYKAALLSKKSEQTAQQATEYKPAITLRPDPIDYDPNKPFDPNARYKVKGLQGGYLPSLNELRDPNIGFRVSSVRPGSDNQEFGYLTALKYFNDPDQMRKHPGWVRVTKYKQEGHDYVDQYGSDNVHPRYWTPQQQSNRNKLGNQELWKAEQTRLDKNVAADQPYWKRYSFKSEQEAIDAFEQKRQQFAQRGIQWNEETTGKDIWQFWNSIKGPTGRARRIMGKANSGSSDYLNAFINSSRIPAGFDPRANSEALRWQRMAGQYNYSNDAVYNNLLSGNNAAEIRYKLNKQGTDMDYNTIYKSMLSKRAEDLTDYMVSDEEVAEWDKEDAPRIGTVAGAAAGTLAPKQVLQGSLTGLGYGNVYGTKAVLTGLNRLRNTKHISANPKYNDAMIKVMRAIYNTGGKSSAALGSLYSKVPNLFKGGKGGGWKGLAARAATGLLLGAAGNKLDNTLIG